MKTDPRLIDWQDGLNPLTIPAYAREVNRFVYDALNSPVMLELRSQPGQMVTYATPPGAVATLAPFGTYDDVVPVRPFSWLVGFSAVSTQPEGFTAQCTDSVSGAAVWSQPAHNLNISGKPIMWLSTPRAISTGGTLSMRLVNLSGAANLVQLVAWVIEEAQP
jgi:hypothetical protein